MTDAEALAAISRTLNQWFDAEIDPYEALNKIAQVIGANRMSK